MRGVIQVLLPVRSPRVAQPWIVAEVGDVDAVAGRQIEAAFDVTIGRRGASFRFSGDAAQAEKEKLDAVMIETTTHARAWITVLALQMGCDVYIEKPMSLTIAEGRAMVRAARKYGRITQVGLDIGVTAGAIMSWAVFAPGQVGKGALAGTYAGATADMVAGLLAEFEGEMAERSDALSQMLARGEGLEEVRAFLFDLAGQAASHCVKSTLEDLLVLLTGFLGAGKTTIAKGLAEGLGLAEGVVGSSLRALTCPSIFSPCTGCSCIILASSGVRGPCFFRMLSSTPIFPMSCRMAARRKDSSSSPSMPIFRAVATAYSCTRLIWPPV